MPDRVIRDELLESERWLDLPTDTDRLVYVGLRIRSDDFGNMEAGARKLYRFLNAFTQIKTEEAAAVILQHLSDADMIRFYKAGEPVRDFVHLPRSRPTGSYLVRKCPPSPWCNPDVKLGKHVRAVRNQGLAKNILVTSIERNHDVSQGIGIGEGKGKGDEKKKKPSARSSKKPLDPAEQAVCRGVWKAYSDSYAFRYSVDPVRNAVVNSQIKAFCKRVPHAEAPAIASFYLGHQQQQYVRSNHPVSLLLRDAEALRTQWATNHQTTETQARLADKTAANKGVFNKLIDEAKAREKSE